MGYLIIIGMLFLMMVVILLFSLCKQKLVRRGQCPRRRYRPVNRPAENGEMTFMN